MGGPIRGEAGGGKGGGAPGGIPLLINCFLNIPLILIAKSNGFSTRYPFLSDLNIPLRRNPIGDRVILVFCGQKPSTRIIFSKSL